MGLFNNFFPESKHSFSTTQLKDKQTVIGTSMVNPKSSHHKIRQKWSINIRDSIKLLNGSYNMFDQSRLIHIINKKTKHFVKKSTSIILLTFSINYRYILTAKCLVLMVIF